MALVLLSTYVAGLLFSMRTHRDLFNPEHEASEAIGLSLFFVGVIVGNATEHWVGI